MQSRENGSCVNMTKKRQQGLYQLYIQRRLTGRHNVKYSLSVLAEIYGLSRQQIIELLLDIGA